MDFGLTMPHSRAARAGRARLLPAEARPPPTCARSSWPSWRSDSATTRSGSPTTLSWARTESTFHTANDSGTRAYPDGRHARRRRHDGRRGSADDASAPGSSVSIAPIAHPMSQRAPVRDGRRPLERALIVGVGSGWDPEEFAAVGADFEHRGAVAEERIEIYKKAWTQPWVEYRGRFFTIETSRWIRSPSSSRTHRSSTAPLASRRAPGGPLRRRPLSDVPRHVR